MHGHDVRVAFHEDGAVFPHDLVSRLVDAVQRPGFVIQRALRAVDVLGDLLVRLECPSAESDDPAGHVADGENDPPSVEIVQGSVFPTFCQPADFQPLLLISRLLCGLDKRPRLPPGRIRTVSDDEIADRGVTKSALTEVAEADALAFPRLHHLLGEPLLRPRRQVGQALPLGLLLLFLLRQLALLDLDAILVGQPPQRLRIGELLVLHQKCHGAAALVGAETLENAFAGHHVKRRGLLVGERTQPAQTRPALFELHKIRDHVFNDGGL